jgi:hypothetical protein
VADERMFAVPCGSPAISGGDRWCEPVSSWMDTLSWGGSSYEKSCSVIETAELSSCVPGVELRSNDVTSVPCMMLGMDSRYGIIGFWGDWWFGEY